MPNFNDMASFVRALESLPVAVQRAMTPTMRACAVLVTKDTQKRLGTYQRGWPHLAPSTQAQRVREGYPADEPLLRSGKMRRSITYSAGWNYFIVGYKIGHDHYTYTPKTSRGKSRTVDVADVALYQEHGDSRLPARPSLGPAFKAEQKACLALISATVVRVMRGRLRG